MIVIAVVILLMRRRRPEGLGGIRYLVLTERDGMITEMKGCANRRVALDYAGMS